MYGEDAQYDEIRMRHPQSNGTGQHYVRNHMTYTEDPDHDLAMEELLEQLPSRQLESVSDLASRTLKGKRMSSRRGNIRLNTSDQLEDQMVETLQQDIDSTEYYVDDIDKAVRTIPTTLSKKRNIKRRLSSRKRGKLTTGKRIKYWFGVNWQRLKHKMRKVSRLFDLWRSHLMTIEGYFGTSVVSYFIFLKWVLLINIPLFLVTFCFLVIPQIVYRYYQKVPPGYSDNTEDFTGDGPFTVFAPTDEAFMKLPPGTLDKLLANKTQLTSVLEYHVVKGTFYAEGLEKDQDVATLQGQKIHIHKQGPMHVEVNKARVMRPNVPVTNGVVHIIDGVLIPPQELHRLVHHN